jgi:hypothetical protein
VNDGTLTEPRAARNGRLTRHRRFASTAAVSDCSQASSPSNCKAPLKSNRTLAALAPLRKGPSGAGKVYLCNTAAFRSMGEKPRLQLPAKPQQWRSWPQRDC